MSTSRFGTYHHGDLRAALLDVAMSLLAQQGPDALSLRSVARQAGVSAMAPYRHYPDKEALLAAVAARGFEMLRAALRAADDVAAPGEALIEQAAAYVGFACANPALFRLMFGARRSGSYPELEAAGAAAHAVLAERVTRDTPPALRDARVLGCWSLVHGLAALALDGCLPHTARGSVEALARSVARSMLRGPA